MKITVTFHIFSNVLYSKINNVLRGVERERKSFKKEGSLLCSVKNSGKQMQKVKSAGFIKMHKLFSIDHFENTG
jgi:hypothetical protein